MLTLLLSTALATEPDYAAECEAGNASSCILLSILGKKSEDPEEQKGAEAWFRKGVGLLDKACSDRTHDACVQLGEVWQVHGDPAEARSAWERACDLDAQKCVDLADRLSQRERTQPELPVALLERACAQEEGLGCIGAAILGEETGRSSKQINAWVEKGGGLLEARCAHGSDPARKAQACSTLGDLNYFGIHRPADKAKGLEFWASGCLDGQACRTQAALLLTQGDREGSIALLRRACELGDCAHWYETCSEVDSVHCKPIPGAEPPPEPTEDVE